MGASERDQDQNADFQHTTLIDPTLHAAEPGSRMTPSPYLPVTRRFVNPIYLRVEDIPETAYLPVAERSLVEWQAEVARPLVGPREFDEHRATDGYDAAGHRSHEGAVIDYDALWSCTTCGACVNQCPVDIEHIDHFLDMRRYQVMIETEFPNELNLTFKNLENKGNPWGMNASKRNDWISEVDFEVPVFGMEGEDEIPAGGEDGIAPRVGPAALQGEVLSGNEGEIALGTDRAAGGGLAGMAPLDAPGVGRGVLHFQDGAEGQVAPGGKECGGGGAAAQVVEVTGSLCLLRIILSATAQSKAQSPSYFFRCTYCRNYHPSLFANTFPHL